MNHGLQPLGDTFPTVANVFVALDTDRPVSAVQALLAALLAPYHNASQPTSAYSDLARVTCELAHPSNLEYDYGAYLKTALAILVSALEHGAVSPASLEPLIEATNLNPEDPQLTDLLTRLEELLRDHRTDGKPPHHRDASP